MRRLSRKILPFTMAATAFFTTERGIANTHKSETNKTSTRSAELLNTPLLNIPTSLPPSPFEDYSQTNQLPDPLHTTAFPDKTWVSGAKWPTKSIPRELFLAQKEWIDNAIRLRTKQLDDLMTLSPDQMPEGFDLVQWKKSIHELYSLIQNYQEHQPSNNTNFPFNIDLIQKAELQLAQLSGVLDLKTKFNRSKQLVEQFGNNFQGITNAFHEAAMELEPIFRELMETTPSQRKPIILTIQKNPMYKVLRWLIETQSDCARKSLRSTLAFQQFEQEVNNLDVQEIILNYVKNNIGTDQQFDQKQQFRASVGLSETPSKNNASLLQKFVVMFIAEKDENRIGSVVKPGQGQDSSGARYSAKHWIQNDYIQLTDEFYWRLRNWFGIQTGAEYQTGKEKGYTKTTSEHMALVVNLLMTVPEIQTQIGNVLKPFMDDDLHFFLHPATQTKGAEGAIQGNYLPLDMVLMGWTLLNPTTPQLTYLPGSAFTYDKIMFLTSPSSRNQKHSIAELLTNNPFDEWLRKTSRLINPPYAHNTKLFQRSSRS